MSLRKNNGPVAKNAMKTIKYDLLKWICKKHAANDLPSRRALRDRALELTKIHGLNTFKCSEGWMTKFLKDHGFSSNLSKPAGPIFDDYRDWIDLMRSTMTRYKYDDLFHADELTMFSDVSPLRIRETRLARNRVTLLICCNSCGTFKLPLLICGSYQSKIVRKEHVYYHSENCVIDDDPFRDWLKRMDDGMAARNRKILLFLRRSRAETVKDLTLANVNLVFLPEDFPPLLRPLRRDVFHYVKMIYRRRYAEHLSQRSSTWTVQDVVDTLIDSWETLPREVVVCSFQRTYFRTDDHLLQIDCDGWDSLRTGMSFKRFVTFDDDLSDDLTTIDRKVEKHRYNLRTFKDTMVIDDSTNSMEDTLSDEEHDVGYAGMVNGKDSVDGSRLEKQVTEDRTKLPGRDERPRGMENMRDALPSGDHPFGSIATSKAQGLQRKSTYVTESVQAIVDKALTMPSGTKIEYVRRLIDSLSAFNEVAGDTNKLEQTKRFDQDARDNTERMETCSSSQPSTSGRQITEETVPNENIVVKTVKSSGESETETLFPGCLDLELIADGDGSPINSGRSSKRRRPKSSDGSSMDSRDYEPDEKRSRLDDWSKKYETSFAFGSRSAHSPDEAGDSCRSSNRSRERQTTERGEESIFNVRPSVAPKQ